MTEHVDLIVFKTLKLEHKSNSFSTFSNITLNLPTKTHHYHREKITKFVFPNNL
jgi:hypothetical protein